VDKAPLVRELQNHPKVKILKKDAFTLTPQDVGPIDWLFSDIICYPDKLLELVNLWLDSGLVRNLVCTIKFQGDTDFKALQGFQSIAGSQIRHLSANKHEVTWSLLREPS
jgi:23S rRNA (cytidine2498-2'-O)-methyltransferase